MVAYTCSWGRVGSVRPVYCARPKDAETRTFTTVWATGGDSVSLCVDLANELGKLVTEKWTTTAKAGLLETLKTIRLNFGIASVALSAVSRHDTPNSSGRPEPCRQDSPRPHVE